MKKKIPKKYKEGIEEYKKIKTILLKREEVNGKDKPVDLSLAIQLGCIRSLLPQHINLCLPKIIEMEEIKYTK